MHFTEACSSIFFAREELFSCAIYFLLRDSEVVYVGQTTSGVARVVAHKNKSFDSVFMLKCVPEELTEKEAEYILKYQPVYNETLPKTPSRIAFSGVLAEVRKKHKFFRTRHLEHIILKHEIAVLSFRNAKYVSPAALSYIVQIVTDTNEELLRLKEAQPRATK